MIVEDTTRARARIADVGGGIEIAYETFGDPTDPTILLVMGLGMQMLAWDEDFCEQLVGRGFRVIRFDNRDIGLSTKVGGGPPNVIAGALGLTGSARYTLTEMAADAAGLLDRARRRPRPPRRRLDGRDDRPDARRPRIPSGSRRCARSCPARAGGGRA